MYLKLTLNFKMISQISRNFCHVFCSSSSLLGCQPVLFRVWVTPSFIWPTGASPFGWIISCYSDSPFRCHARNLVVPFASSLFTHSPTSRMLTDAWYLGFLHGRISFASLSFLMCSFQLFLAFVLILSVCGYNDTFINVYFSVSREVLTCPRCHLSMQILWLPYLLTIVSSILTH
jgi:hypothetical protein